MRRGDLVTVAMPGDFGKPRPALIIQADTFDANSTATVTILLISSTLVESPLFRITIDPTPDNGLRETSQIMVDKAMTVWRDKLGSTFGRIEDERLIEVNRALSVFLGIT